MTVLRPFLSYFGAKWRTARHYPAPRHDRIVEPFAGSAGYSVRHAERDVVLVDSYPPVVAAWRYLISAREADLRALPDVEDGQSVRELGVSYGAECLIGFWLHQGVATPGIRPSAWLRRYRTEKPNWTVGWGPRLRERLARQLAAIRHWTIIEGDYRNAPRTLSTWFVDPPYVAQGRKYPSQPDSYEDLAEWCRGLPGQVIVCESKGAEWLPFTPHMQAKVMSGHKRSGRFAEAIWTNEEPEAERC